MKRKSIIYIIDNLTLGGAQTQLTRLVQGLILKDVKVKVICLGRFDKSLVRQIGPKNIQFLKMHSIWQVCFWKNYVKLQWILRKENPTIVHTYLNTANVFGALAAKKAKVPIIITSRRDMGHFRTERIAKMEMMTNSFVDRIVCVSKAVQKKTVMTEGVPIDKTTVLYGGVDSSVFQKSKNKSTPNGQLCVGMVATMDRAIKGHQEFVETAREVLKQRQDIKFVLVGDGSLRESLEKSVKDYKIDSYVEFPGSSKNIRAVLDKFDIFVMPSHSEGFSNAILEAMSMEVPVVANAIEGNLEIIQEGVSGYLVKPQDIKDMADTITLMADSKAQIPQWGSNARKRILNDFTIEHMVERYRAFYNDLIEQKGLSDG